MHKKIIFTDLDGTILKYRNEINWQTKKLVKKLRKKDIPLIIASGRPYCACLPIYQQLKLNCLLISDTGACISNPSDPNFKTIRQVIPLAIFLAFYEAVRECITCALFNLDDYVYINNNHPYLDYFIHEAPSEKIFRGDFNNLTVSPSGLLVLVKNNAEFQSKMEHFPLLGWRYWGEYKHFFLYEVHLKAANKGNAALAVLNYYNFTKEEALAFGDGLNDLELFNTIPGVAMLNAHPELKEKAIAITKKTNKKAGLAHFLKKYLSRFD